MFQGEEYWGREKILDGEDEVVVECIVNCKGDASKCDACAWKYAIIVRDRELEVQ